MTVYAQGSLRAESEAAAWELAERSPGIPVVYRDPVGTDHTVVAAEPIDIAAAADELVIDVVGQRDPGAGAALPAKAFSPWKWIVIGMAAGAGVAVVRRLRWDWTLAAVMSGAVVGLYGGRAAHERGWVTR